MFSHWNFATPCARSSMVFRRAAAVAFSLGVLGCQAGNEEGDAKVSRGLVSQYASFARLSSEYLELEPAEEDERPSDSGVPRIQGGVQAALSLGSIGMNAMGILSPAVDESATVITVGGRQGRGPRSSGIGEGCECEDDRCKFVDCKTGGGGTLNGTFSWTKTTMKCDYELVFSGTKDSEEFHYHHVECDLTYGEATIEGELSSKGSYKATVQDKLYNTDWDLDMDFQGVELDDYGRPKKGKVDVEASVVSHTYGDRLSGARVVDFEEES